MVRVSNNLVGILNFITLLLSIPIIGGGIWLSKQANTECERFLDKPVIALGVFILLVSLAGLVGSCCRVSWLLWVYLFVMFMLIVLLFCFTIFAFVVTNKGAGEKISGKGYKEYRLGDYSNWLQKRVNGNWGKIRSCLEASKICQKLLEDGSTPVEIFTNNTCLLSSLVAVNHRTIAISSTLAPQTGIQLRPQSMTIQIALCGKTTQMFCATTVKHARLDCWITSRVTGRGWLLSISYSSSSLSLFTLSAAARSETTEKITMPGNINLEPIEGRC